MHFIAKLKELWKTEPTMVLASAQMVVALLVAFATDFAPERIGLITAVSATLTGFFTRTQVSPTRDMTEKLEALRDAGITDEDQLPAS